MVEILNVLLALLVVVGPSWALLGLDALIPIPLNDAEA